MAKRTASAKKQARAGARRTVRNRAAKSEVKTLIVKARRAITDTSDTASERVAVGVAAIKSLDRAAAKGVLHGNNAARRKSRLAKQLAKLSAAASAEAQAAAAKAASEARPGRGLRRLGRS
ncbi:MAG TPA: 30S ribosomal protein S20 [Candidatus Dormibacteraeota bacterium]|nr:30S ribosomal protein S20 [Candidatus Dormibacteraeota bacterium]